MSGEQGALTWGWTYDKNGRVKTATDPKGQVVTSTWGVLGRLTRQDYTNHAAPRELPSIDSIGYVRRQREPDPYHGDEADRGRRGRGDDDARLRRSGPA